MKKIFATFAFLLAVLAWPMHANAENADAGLYDPLPPDGSAFVRFVNAYDSKGSKEAKINGKSYEYVSYMDLSSYFVAPQGDAKIVVGDASTDYTLDGGKFYTIVLKDKSDLEVIKDPEHDNLAKSQIIFYNLTPQEKLELKTSDGKVSVIPPVSPDATGVQQINPVKVSLAVYDGDKALNNLGAVSLERSRSYNVVTYPNNEVRWTISQTNTTR